MIRGSPSTIVVSLAKAFMLSFVRPFATFASSRFCALASFERRLLTDARDEVVDVDPRVPELEVPHRGERADALPVRPADLEVDRRSLLLVEAAVTPGDGEARDEPLDVPFERPRQRLVEVVEAEHELAVGGGKAAEVREVRVAAELRVEARPRPAREIGGHQVGGAAVERERRHQHAAVADRHELGHAGLGLLLEQLDRVGAMRGRLPVAV